MEDFCGSEFWNPDLSWSETNPDLTFCFKQTVLIWVPCGFFWLFLPLDVITRWSSRYSNIPWTFLNVSKYFICLLLICLSIADLTMMLIEEEHHIFDVQIVSVSIKIATFFCIAIIQHFHKLKGHVSSGLLFNFWLLFVVCSAPQFRSEIIDFDTKKFDIEDWSGFQFINFMIFFSFLVIMMVLNLFADSQPKHTTYPKSVNPSSELSSSFVNQIFFFWFDPLTWKGWKRPLVERDIYDINPQDTCAELLPPFDKYFKESAEKRKRKMPADTKLTNGSITSAMSKAYGGPFWFSALLRILSDALLLATPFLLGALINYVEDGGALWKGIFLTITLFLVTFLQAVINGQYFFKNFLVGYRIRSGLINSIYRKALKISSAVKKELTVGEIVNLMAVDANRFFDLLPNFHVIWSGPVIIGICIYFLWQYLGLATAAGLVVTVLTIPISILVAAKLKNLQIQQMKIKDERVKNISEILGGIKVLKLYAWELSFEQVVSHTRAEEMKILISIAMYNAASYFIWSLAPFLISMASFITFVLMGEVLTPEIAFVSLALFNILRFPMTFMPMMLNFLMQSVVAIKRINKFMNSEEISAENVTHEPNEHALEIKNGSFSWSGTEPCLKNINIKVKKGSLTAIVGAVGAGKSSLISALLGEMEKVNGSVNIDGRVAYVPQQAWIQNATLQDNITFGRPFVKQFYNKVIEACALVSDLTMLPGGDQTEIGEKGINLSGGQKQRVSLARAVYSGADIFILDDPLSAVDSHIGKHIFDNVLSENGVLKGKTRFLVTHSMIFIPQVNEILVMVNGEIAESGSYRELLTQKKAFAKFLLQYLQEHQVDNELLDVEQIIDDPDESAIVRKLSSVTSGAFFNGSIKRRSQRRKSSEASTMRATKASFSKLIDSEEAATGSVGVGVYIRYFKSVGIGMTFIGLFTNMLYQAFNVFSNFWLTEWSLDERAGTEIRWRNIYAGVYGALGAAQGITLLSSATIFAIGCLHVARDGHNNLMNNILRLPMSFFDVTPLGRIVNRFSRDIDVVDNVLPMFVRLWIFMLFSVLSIFIVISISTPLFLAALAPIVILYYFIQKFYIETSRQLRRMESITRSPIYAHFSESITGQSTIRAYNEQKRFTAESGSKVDYNQSIAYQGIIANRWLAIRLEIIGAFVVLFASLFAVLQRDTISNAIVGLSISYALQISQTMGFFIRMIAEVETNIVAIERIEEYIKREQEAPWKKNEVDPTWPQNGIVEFKNFQVRYRDGLDLVLKGIDFAVRAQEKIGIVGRTGAGKSSLTLSLFRIIEAAGGNIIIDGIDISEIGLHSLRSKLTIIPQDPVLFSGTLRMNIDPFNLYSDDTIWLALEHSHLKTFVKSLPDGLMHKITECGENLSLGQRQLICLARALLRKTKVLILDEATAAIDLETDELIQKTIRSQFNDCTILTIAHRLNTIMDSDRVIVLHQGMIAEFDAPETLLANSNSIFYGMAKDAGLINDNVIKISQSEEIVMGISNVGN